MIRHHRVDRNLCRVNRCPYCSSTEERDVAVEEDEKRRALLFLEQTRIFADEARKRARARNQRFWAELAGRELDKMMLSPLATQEYLRHADAKFRQVAIGICIEHWGLNKAIAPALEKIAREDTDETVRSVALLYLGTHAYNSSNDKRIGKILVGVLKDQSSSLLIVKRAYLALFGLRGIPPYSWPQVWSKQFRFPEDVDWPFVNSHLSSHTGKEPFSTEI
jgi:hypothetical protein